MTNRRGGDGHVFTFTARAVLPALLAGAALAIGACGDDDEPSGGEQAAQGGGEPAQITYSQPTPPSLLFYPPLVAEALGFFEEENVEAELAPAAEEIPSTAFLENGDADIALSDVDEIVIARSKGGEQVVVFSPQHSNTAGTVVPEDSEVQSFADLAGSRVGLASEEDTAIFEAQLQDAGLSKGDVETVVVGTAPATIANTFEKGDIDAYVGAVSDFTALAANDVALRNITSEGVGDIDGNPMAVMPDTLSSKREGLVGFLRAWAKAQYVGLSKPEVVEAIVREEVPAEWRNEAVGEAALQNAIELFTPDEEDRIGDLRPEVWETSQELLSSVGIIEETIPIQDALDDQLVAEINDFDRAAVDQAADQWLQENGG
jgi:NitT/TauT family transport system substrate-binding protein